MERRKLLHGIALVGTSTAIVGNASSKTKKGEITDEEYRTLKSKYGEKEASIITKGVNSGESVENILEDDRLTKARGDYIEYQYSRGLEASEINEEILQMAEEEDVIEADDLRLNSSNWNFDQPCKPEIPYTSTNNSTPVYEWDTFWNQDANKSQYGLGSCSYRSGCDIAAATRLNASATSGLYGGAQVELAHVTTELSLEGDYTIVGEFDAKGAAPGGSADFNALKYDSTTGVIQRENLKTITSQINKTFRGQTTFNLSNGDHLGLEISAQADGTAGSGTADFRSGGRGATPVLEIYEL